MNRSETGSDRREGSPDIRTSERTSNASDYLQPRGGRAGNSNFSEVLLSSDERVRQEWRTVGGESLRWRCWSGDYVVFNPASGQTHMMDILSGHILQTIKDRAPVSLDEICAEVSTFLEVDNDVCVLAGVIEMLRRLEELELITSIC